MSAYNPKEVESKWPPLWDQFLKADPRSSKPPFCVIMPPPNVTGVLHMGHALVNTLQDILVRWKRMKGFEVLWVPGTDHAGISTQTVVERHLMATLGKRRKDFSREEFLAHVWEWKEKSQGQILSQIRRLGCSCDWSRLAFTLDPHPVHVVRTCFKKMFDAGIIYRGNYLVNWDPQTETALADDEVEYEERDGFLYYLRYPIEGTTGQIIVATTRPETMLGDMAVAVNPKDDRYDLLVGKQVRLPLTSRLIPILADRFVDPEFGTGAVKITPAHDPNDYEMAGRHSLDLLNIMTPDGKINENGGEFQGLTMKEARVAIITQLKALNLIEQIVPHRNRVGISYRSKADIEPYLSKQWFVKTTAFKEELIACVKEGKVQLIPPHWESTYFHWIDNLRDWCISRQLWWGHRIPIWYKKEDPEKLLCHMEDSLPPEMHPDEWVQDEDVLDTWFSSATWPFSVLGWPDNTDDFKKFYPTTTLITGHDILFFWVARMLIMGKFATGEYPFAQTFLHGLVYAKSYWRFNKEGALQYITGKERQDFELGTPIPADVNHKWEKMSKSKGNILDPIEIIDTYGTDAMRFTLAAGTTHARQLDLDLRRFEEYKHFANKIWNGARFVFMNLEGLTAESLAQGINPHIFSLEDRWILSLFNRTVEKVNHHLTHYAFDHAATLTYEFFWKEFCAYYVELTKPILFGKKGTPEAKENKQKLLLTLLVASLRLIHPFAPFITEELFQQLKAKVPLPPALPAHDPLLHEALQALQAPSCMVAPYPEHRAKEIDQEAENTFDFMDKVLLTIRTIRAEMQLPPSALISLYVSGEEKEVEQLKSHASILEAMVRLEAIHYHITPPLGVTAEALVHHLKLQVPLPTELKEKEKMRLLKEQEKLIAGQNTLRHQLANEAFLQKAPPELIEKLKENLAQNERSLKTLESTLKKIAE